MLFIIFSCEDIWEVTAKRAQNRSAQNNEVETPSPRWLTSSHFGNLFFFLMLISIDLLAGVSHCAGAMDVNWRSERDPVMRRLGSLVRQFSPFLRREVIMRKVFMG